MRENAHELREPRIARFRRCMSFVMASGHWGLPFRVTSVTAAGDNVDRAA
jgi:hypothetical protein